jgi:hypothetical protein
VTLHELPFVREEIVAGLSGFLRADDRLVSTER